MVEKLSVTRICRDNVPSTIEVMFNILLSIAKESTSKDPYQQLATPGRSSRDGLVCTVYKQHRARNRILEPYRRMKGALKQLQEEYLQSKENNAIMRYMRMQDIVAQAVLLEKQYWKLLEIPTQEPSEDQQEYVVRVVTLLDQKSSEQPPPSAGGIGALLGNGLVGKVADSRVEQGLLESIKSQRTDDLQRECEHMYGALYKLIRKYIGLKRILRELNVKFEETRHYPIVPRYSMLKNMIKNALRAPEFADICHEQTE